jgi:hypothetical protein
MQYTKFGRTGLRVSKLCLGTMTFGLQCDDTQSHAILDAAAEGGIDFLDSADVYPVGGGPATAAGPRRSWAPGLRANANSSFWPQSALGKWDQSHGTRGCRASTRSIAILPAGSRCA